MLGELKQTLCAPGPRDPTETRPELCLSPVEVLVSNSLPQGQGLWVQTWVWYQPSWMRSPLIPPQSRRNLHRTGETDSWGYKQNLVCTRTQKKGAVILQESDPDLPRNECPGVSGRSVDWQWLEAGSGTLSAAVCAGDFLKEVAIIFITSTIVWSGQTTGREHSPAHQQKIVLKFYWAWAHPSEQDPVSPTVSLSYQEASISLLSLPFIGQTEWKPQSQRIIQLIMWTTTLSNSVKLWAMPYRATQKRQIMVEKTLSTGEDDGKPLQHSCLENPMNSMKRVDYKRVYIF